MSMITCIPSMPTCAHYPHVHDANAGRREGDWQMELSTPSRKILHVGTEGTPPTPPPAQSKPALLLPGQQDTLSPAASCVVASGGGGASAKKLVRYLTQGGEEPEEVRGEVVLDSLNLSMSPERTIPKMDLFPPFCTEEEQQKTPVPPPRGGRRRRRRWWWRRRRRGCSAREGSCAKPRGASCHLWN